MPSTRRPVPAFPTPTADAATHRLGTGPAAAAPAPAPPPPDAGRAAHRLLARAAAAWAAVALGGQLLFAGYVAGFYGGSALAGNLAAWGEVMPHGWEPGRPLANAVVALHLALAVVILVGGAVQLLPAVRRRAPALHRGVGRAYLLAAVGAAVGGTWLVWGRGTVGDVGQHLGTTWNAVLLVACAALAWRAVRRRDVAAHRRWALRTYLAANGVWFFRLGLMLWLLAWRRPVGFDADRFVGPFLTTLAFAQTLLPLAVLELYLRAEARGTARARRATAGLLAGLTLVTAAGIVAAALGLWLPRLRG